MAKTRGRPKLDPSGEESTLFLLRLTQSERAQYDRAAKRAGVKLSAWMRECLSKAAGKAPKRG